MKLIEEHSADTHILYDADYIENPATLSFDSQEWAARSAIIGFAEGRGTTFFIQHQGRDYVLRHYQRGGLVARWLEDRYLWLGLSRTRAWREWRLLAVLRQKKLPVPVPVAVRVHRQGLFYTADILTLRIAKVRTLADELCQNRLDKGYWIALGGVLRRFHQQGVYHADLNANNILLDAGGCYHLIDFDRGRLRKPVRSWQKANLARFKRSLEKIKSQSLAFDFSEEDWHNLLQGYGWED